MKKGIKALIGITSALSLIECGLCFFAYYEVLNRNAKVPGKIYKSTKKKNREKAAKEPKKSETPERKYIKECEKWFSEQAVDEYEIINSRGQKLKGHCIPCENSDKYVFCSHGYRSSGEWDFCRLMKFYHENGINVFFVDHSWAGKSEGEWITFGRYEAEDCIQWLNFIVNEFSENIEIFLHGISLGSGTVMLMSGRRDLPENVKFTVADCGYTTMAEEFTHNLTLVKIPVFPLMQITDIYNRVINNFRYSEVQPIENIKKAKIPVLFIHGSKDNFVPVRMAYQLYDACKSEKELVIIDGAGHADSHQTNPKLYESKIKEFIDRYL